jgi:hypothetical protein
MVFSIGGLILLAYLGSLLWSWWEGLCAATFISAIPYYRVLSTTAYPDVEACFWTTLTITLALLSIRKPSPAWRYSSALGSGFSIVLAISTKAFSATAAAPLLILTGCSDLTRRCKAKVLLAIVAGAFIGLLLETALNDSTAGDPWFSWRSHRSTQTELAATAGDGVTPTPTSAAIAYRLIMPFDRGRSGWGIIGFAFWPVIALSLFTSPRSRWLAIWALAVYLPLAIFPISLDAGWELFPHFHGRHALTAMIPFTLCLAGLIGRLRFRSQSVYVHCWPLVLTCSFLLQAGSSNDINGFRDRDTRRVGVAIKRMISDGLLAGDMDIFMTPSMYWRFRILFPPEVRSRLRVSSDEEAPPWWRDTTIDIQDRQRPLPTPEHALLLATPRQLVGRTETWDYGVALPRRSLDTWQSSHVIAACHRTKQRQVSLVRDAVVDPSAVLLLLGQPASSQLVERPQEPAHPVR